MRFSRTKCWILAGVLLAAVAAVRADESLKAACSAILRGDYGAGRASLGRLLGDEPAAGQAEEVSRWLDAYEQVVSSREQLRRKTFEWNVEQAKRQLEEDKIYLALSFAAQAVPYAADEQEFAKSGLARKLREKALAEAERLASSEQWTKAHTLYIFLQRIDENDELIETLQERAARHARFEIIYETHEDVQRRIKDVSREMMHRALDLINDYYYEKPDFEKMAGGALENLIALCTTTKLYKGVDAPQEFDGLADPIAREHFLEALEREKRQVSGHHGFSQRDLAKLFNRLEQANKVSVSLPTELLIIEFMEGALDELDDFTSIVWPADSTEFDKMMVGNFVGVGIQLGLEDASGRLKVVTPLENSPALEAGIQPGDLIVKVDGQSTRNWSTDKAVREITGPAGTSVVLTMYRPRVGEYLDFELTRRAIKLTTIRGVERLNGGDGNEWNFMLDEDAGIAYIRLTNFNPDSTQELLEALRTAQIQGMRGLVLDLRHNPGGLLDVVVEMVSTFLRYGDVVKTSGRGEDPQVLEVTGKTRFSDLPLVLLVNEHSASASEILAGALGDHGRAKLLGERTFGKGSVQRVYPLQRPSFLGGSRANARLKLTTALYYLPNGKSPHKLPGAERWGVEPDWKIKLTPKEFSKVIERQNSAFVIHNEDESDEALDDQQREAELAALKAEDEEDDDELLSDADIKLLRSDPLEAPDVDPQLETALLHLRVKLAANMPWPERFAQKMQADKHTR